MLIVDGNISSGDTASVTDAGEAKSGSGPLHCASEAEDGFAWFVRALAPAPANVWFRAPAAGIASGAIEPCEVIDYSDERMVEANEMVMVESRWPETVGDGGQVGMAFPWGDHFRAGPVWEDCE